MLFSENWTSSEVARSSAVLKFFRVAVVMVKILSNINSGTYISLILFASPVTSWSSFRNLMTPFLFNTMSSKGYQVFPPFQDTLNLHWSRFVIFRNNLSSFNLLLKFVVPLRVYSIEFLPCLINAFSLF